jgi:hypothetical protein
MGVPSGKGDFHSPSASQELLYEALLLLAVRGEYAAKKSQLAFGQSQDLCDSSLFVQFWTGERHFSERLAAEKTPFAGLVVLRGKGLELILNVVRLDGELNEIGNEARLEPLDAIGRADDAGFVQIVAANGAIVG